jgi:hypothetical protein
LRGFERVPSLLVGAARPGAGTRGGTGTGACSQPAGHVVQGGTQALHMFHQFHAGIKAGYKQGNNQTRFQLDLNVC